jgi:hypothetical protein
MPTISVSISDKNYIDIIKASQLTGFSISSLVNNALSTYLEDLLEDLTEGKRISQEIKEGKQKTLTSKELKDSLGI